MQSQCSFCKKSIHVQAYKLRLSKNFFCNKTCANYFKKKSVSLTCPICNKSFDVPKHRIKKTKIICCSKTCSYEHSKRTNCITKICKFCNQTFTFKASKETKNGKKFCSRNCSNQVPQKAPFSSKFKHGIYTYRIKALNNFPNECLQCKTKTRKLVVHHIDKNRLNNALSNLMVLCHSCHRKLP